MNLQQIETNCCGLSSVLACSTAVQLLTINSSSFACLEPILEIGSTHPITSCVSKNTSNIVHIVIDCLVLHTNIYGIIHSIDVDTLDLGLATKSVGR